MKIEFKRYDANDKLEDGLYICIKETDLIKGILDGKKSILNINSMFDEPFKYSLKEHNKLSDEEVEKILNDKIEKILLDVNNLCLLKYTKNKFVEVFHINPYNDDTLGLILREIKVVAYCRIDEILFNNICSKL